MRAILFGGLLLLGSCVHTTFKLPDIPCDPACPPGRVCDPAIGECKADACGGNCQKWEKCVGTDDKAHCENVPNDSWKQH